MTTDDRGDLFPPAQPPGGPPPDAPLLPATDDWSAGKPTKGVRLPIPVLVAVLAIVALGGLWGGAQLKGDNSSAATTTAAGGGTGRAGRNANGYGFAGNGNGNGGNGGARFGGTRGTVESVDGDTITIKTQDGQTVTVKVGSTTTVTKVASGSASDIATGDTLVVRGQTASDGSTTAQSITVGDASALASGGFPGGGAPPADPPTTAN